MSLSFKNSVSKTKSLEPADRQVQHTCQGG